MVVGYWGDRTIGANKDQAPHEMLSRTGPQDRLGAVGLELAMPKGDFQVPNGLHQTCPKHEEGVLACILGPDGIE